MPRCISLTFLPANQRFAFVFGTTLLRLHSPQGAETLFFVQRVDAQMAADRCGLKVFASGRVETKERESEFTLLSERFSDEYLAACEAEKSQ